MSEEGFKRIRSYFHTAVAILFLLFVAYATRTMDIELETSVEKVPPLAELAIPAVASYIVKYAQDKDTIIDIIQKVPANRRFIVVSQLFEKEKFKKLSLTPEDKLKIIYEAVREISVPIIAVAVQILVNKALVGIDPCVFVNKKIGDIIPNETDQPSAFGTIVMRELLKLPNIHLPEKTLQNSDLQLWLAGHIDTERFMISPDNKFVAIIVDQKSILVWNIQSNSPAVFFDAQVPSLTELEWGPSNLLVAGSNEGNIYFWHIDQLDQAVTELKLQGKHLFFSSDLSGPESDTEFMNSYKQYLDRLSEEKRFDAENFLVTLENIYNNDQDILPAINVLAVYSQPKGSKPFTWFISRVIAEPLYTIKPKEIERSPIKSIAINASGTHMAASYMSFLKVWDITDLSNIGEVWSSKTEFTGPEAIGLGIDNNARFIAFAPVYIEVADQSFAEIRDLKTEEIKYRYATDPDYDELGAHSIALSTDGKFLAHRMGEFYKLQYRNDLLGLVDRKHSDATAIFGPIFFDNYGVQSLVACGGPSGRTVVYSTPSNGNLQVELLNRPGSIDSFNELSLVTYEFTLGKRAIDSAVIWRLPTDYLYGHFSWSELRDLLAPRCLAIVPK